MSRNELTNATVLVTGAASGIGRATALAFAKQGARVLCADLDDVGAKQTAEDCIAAGASIAQGYAVDVSDEASMTALATQIHGEHGVLDVLVNNAGVGMSGHFSDMSFDDWKWISSVNIDGVILGCKIFGQPMAERGTGHVVNVSSGLGYTPHATEAAYVTTKAAVLAFSQSLRADWHEHGVTVTAICPGIINPPIVEATRFLGATPTSDRSTAKLLFKRGHRPEKVAKAIVRSVSRPRVVAPVGIESKLGWLAHRYAPIAMQQRIARQDLGHGQGVVLPVPAGRAFTVTTDDGASLAATELGPHDGRLVVLAHCWTGSRAIWAPVAELLAERGNRVVLYDQRGHGASTSGSDGYTIERVGLDLRDVLEHIDAHDAIVAGHSLGGMAIQSLASTRPDVIAQRCSRVVLVATSAKGMAGSNIKRLAGTIVGSRVSERAVGSRAYRRVLRDAVATDADAFVATRDHFLATAPEVRRDVLGAIHSMDLRALRAIDVPVAVVIGERDGLTPPKRGHELADRLGAETYVLDGIGHMIPLEAPRELADVIASARRPA